MFSQTQPSQSPICTTLAAGSAPLRPGIQQIIGRVTVNGKVAESGMLVGPGDTIVSEANSQAIYVIGQDAFLQRAGSTVAFSGGNGVEVLRILSGKLLSVFGRGNKRIETTTAVIGIRGTGDVEVLSELSEQARVITPFPDKLADGARVTAPGS